MEQLTSLAQEAAVTVKEALLASHRAWRYLGTSGLQSVNKNQFGDTALRGDIKAEEAVLAVVAHSNFNARIFSEEHGEQKLGHSQGINIIGVLDGIDGSSDYIKDREHGKYGTMFGLFAGEDPKYADYLATGIMLHASAELLLGVRGKGAVIINVNSGKSTPIHTKPDQSLNTKTTTAYVDNAPLDRDHPLHEYFALNNKIFAEPLHKIGVETLWLGASAAYYAAIATGNAHIVGESTRKGNLEIATAYGIIKESGGVMTTTDGQDIGTQSLLSFGQNSHIPVLTTSNLHIANEFVRLLMDSSA